MDPAASASRQRKQIRAGRRSQRHGARGGELKALHTLNNYLPSRARNKCRGMVAQRFILITVVALYYFPRQKTSPSVFFPLVSSF